MTKSFDMLSLLPESLIIIIISLLPFPEAVRTSILSKTWANAKLFKKTTNLEFNERFFVKYDDDQPLHQREAQRSAFLHFIKTWIHDPIHHKSTVDRFCLRLSMNNNVIDGYDIAQKCIAFAIQHGVKELELDFSSQSWYENTELFNLSFVPFLFELRKEIYKHTCLRSLKLYKCGFDDNGFNKFHALKEVYFGFMGVSASAINNMLSNCKMLESVSLIKCWGMNNDFDIRDENGKLRKLVVDWCIYNFRSDTFKVIAPNLKYFKYFGVLRNFDIKGAVEEAYFDFVSEFIFPGSEVRLYTLMKNICAVKVLTICSHFLQLIAWGREQERLERNLNIRHLTMRTKLLDKIEYDGIRIMLASCPVLECLTIELSSTRAGVNSETILAHNPMDFWRRRNARVCYESSVKVVEVKGFKGINKNEFHVIESFIRYGKDLKKMNINIVEDEKDGTSLNSQARQLAEPLLSIPRASSDLEITIS